MITKKNIVRIAAYYPNFFHISGIAYCALSIIEAMQSEMIEVSLMGISSGRNLKERFYSNAIPAYLSSIAYKFFPENIIKKISANRFAKTLDGSEVLYLWPGITLELYKKMHRNGHRIVMESVNTHHATSIAILDAEYKRLDLPLLVHEEATEENAKLMLSNFIFSCSPEVRQSLIAAEVPASKILDTSYGLRKSDVLSLEDIEARTSHEEITAIFVGSIGVRKGPHLLLDYWCRSKVKGKLKLVGDIEPEIKHIIEPYLERLDIEHVPFVDDLREVYKQADVFVLPSLEEGSPLVTYLALGAGLPSIASPMGGGGVIDHDENGYIIDAHDDLAWIDALQTLFNDAAKRQNFSLNAYKKAPCYLWSEVGRKRAEILVSKLNEGT